MKGPGLLGRLAGLGLLALSVANAVIFWLRSDELAGASWMGLLCLSHFGLGGLAGLLVFHLLDEWHGTRDAEKFDRRVAEDMQRLREKVAHGKISSL